MEEGQKRQNSLRSRFRECFKPGGPQSRVPLDIWKHILLNTDPQSLGGMAQTSKPFEEVVREDIRVNNYELARRYRKEGQIHLALKCLKSCVDHNHSEATFQLGYAYDCGGWGLSQNIRQSRYFISKAIELGSIRAMVFMRDIKFDINDITDSFALGLYYHHNCSEKDFEYFKDSALKGDDLGQYYIAHLYYRGFSVDMNVHKARAWYTKSAEQGNGRAQYALGNYFSLGSNMRWAKRANIQKTTW